MSSFCSMILNPFTSLLFCHSPHCHIIHLSWVWQYLQNSVFAHAVCLWFSPYDLVNFFLIPTAGEFKCYLIWEASQSLHFQESLARLPCLTLLAMYLLGNLCPCLCVCVPHSSTSYTMFTNHISHDQSTNYVCTLS